MRPADLPLVKMYPVILIAALTRGSKVCFRVAKGDDGVGHNGLRQSEELLLGLYPVHLGPGAQPDCAQPQLLCGEADVLGGTAGYDIANEYDRVFTEFDEVVGGNYLCAIHLNDSKKPLGSRVDRHDSIGKGLIGIDFFRRFMQDSRFNDMPVILETPDDTIWRDEIKMLRSFEL